MLKSRKCSLSGSLSQNRTHGKFPGDGHGSLALITTLCFRKVHSLFMAAKHNKRAEFEIFWSGWKHLMNGWKLCSPKCGGGWRCELGGRTQRQDNDISQAKARNWIIHMVQKTYGENSFPTPRCDSAFYRPLHTASRTECLFPPPSLSLLGDRVHLHDLLDRRNVDNMKAQNDRPRLKPPLPPLLFTQR